MAHVTLDGDQLTGIFALPQPQLEGYIEIPDGDPRIVVFLARFEQPKPTQAEGTTP